MVSDVGNNLPGNIKHLFRSLFDGVHPLDFRGGDEDMPMSTSQSMQTSTSSVRDRARPPDSCVESLVRDGFTVSCSPWEEAGEAGSIACTPMDAKQPGDLKLC